MLGLYSYEILDEEELDLSEPSDDDVGFDDAQRAMSRGEHLSFLADGSPYAEGWNRMVALVPRVD